MNRLCSIRGRGSTVTLRDATTLIVGPYSGRTYILPAPQSAYRSDFSAIVANVTGSSRDGWSRDSTHAHAVRPPVLCESPSCTAVATRGACHVMGTLLHA